MLTYLGLSALLVFAAALALAFVADASPLALTHLVLLVAIAPLIFGAITHFVPVLTRGRGAHRAVLLLPVALQAAGFLVFLHFSGDFGLNALYLAAAIMLFASCGFAGWLIVRARSTLGYPHPGWRWYLAAVAVLIAGLLLVPAMYLWPMERQGLRLLHLHLNTLGFIGLTAVGTLQVLLPTVFNAPDAEAAGRLRRHLSPMLAGVFLVGFGAAWWWPLSLVGTGLLGYPVLQLGHSWLRRYGWSTLFGHGAAASLFAALNGFLLLLVGGLLHAAGWLAARDSVPAFFAAFLLPLVTGALTQLLPVWRKPGRRTPQRDRMQALMNRGGVLRSALFMAGGVVLALGYDEGVVLTGIGLLLFLCVTALALLLPEKKSIKSNKTDYYID